MGILISSLYAIGTLYGVIGNTLLCNMVRFLMKQDLDRDNDMPRISNYVIFYGVRRKLHKLLIPWAAKSIFNTSAVVCNLSTKRMIQMSHIP